MVSSTLCLYLLCLIRKATLGGSCTVRQLSLRRIVVFMLATQTKSVLRKRAQLLRKNWRPLIVTGLLMLALLAFVLLLRGSVPLPAVQGAAAPSANQAINMTELEDEALREVLREWNPRPGQAEDPQRFRKFRPGERVDPVRENGLYQEQDVGKAGALPIDERRQRKRSEKGKRAKWAKFGKPEQGAEELGRTDQEDAPAELEEVEKMLNKRLRGEPIGERASDLLDNLAVDEHAQRAHHKGKKKKGKKGKRRRQDGPGPMEVQGVQAHAADDREPDRAVDGAMRFGAAEGPSGANVAADRLGAKQGLGPRRGKGGMGRRKKGKRIQMKRKQRGDGSEDTGAAKRFKPGDDSDSSR
eukprot:g40390.t1